MSAYYPDFLFEYNQEIEGGLKEVKILVTLERI